MPVGPYKNFAACVKAIMREKKFDKERASAYCAAIEHRATGEWLGAKSAEAEVINVSKERYSLDSCMESGCDQPPAYDVLWDRGRSHCWLCKEHFIKWLKPEREPVSVKKIDLEATRWSENGNPNIWDIEKGKFEIEFVATGLEEPDEKVAKSEDAERVAIYKIDHKKQLIYGTFLEPLKVDSQGDFEFAEEVQKAVHGYMINSRKIGVGHKGGTIPAEPVEIYQAPCDFWFDGTPHDEEHKVLKDSGVAVVKVYDKDVFARVEKGELNGFSIQGWGTRRKVKIKTNKVAEANTKSHG